MSCGNYREVTVNYCPNAFQFSGYGSEVYIFWEFVNVSGQRVTGETLTSSEGVLTLPVDDTIGLTKELFQHFNGIWKFRSYAYDEAGNINPLIFCESDQPYDDLVLNFQFIDPLPEPNNLAIILTSCVLT